MREHISRQKKTTTGFSIPSLKHPTSSFGLGPLTISRQAVPEIQPLDKPLTHDISRIPLRSPKAKLSISQPGDIYEQEADSVAQQVMQRMAQPVNRQSIQREALPEDEEELQMKPLANSITPLVQREALPDDEEELQMKSLDNSTLQREALPEDEEELQMKSLDNSTLQREALPEDEEELQMKSLDNTTLQREALPEDEEGLQMKPSQGEAGMAAVPDLEASINQARGGGVAIADNIREPMEQAFGADFSGVKVHTDGQSDQLNRSIQARAFTTGQDVFFRSGEYNPGSRGGQELLAHELTHVVQQGARATQRTDAKGGSSEGGSLPKYSEQSRVLQRKGVGGNKIGFKRINDKDNKEAWEKLKLCWQEAKNRRKLAKTEIERTLPAQEGKGGFTAYYATKLDEIKDERELLVEALEKNSKEPPIVEIQNNQILLVTVEEGKENKNVVIGELIDKQEELYEGKKIASSTMRETYKKKNALAEGSETGENGEKEYIKDTRGVYTRRYAYHEMNYHQMMDFVMSGELTGRYQMFMSAGEAANTSPQKIAHPNNKKEVSKRKKIDKNDLTWEEVAVLHQWKGSGPYQSGVSLTSTSREEVRSNKGGLFKTQGGFRVKIDLAKVAAEVPIVNDYAEGGVSQKPAKTTKIRPARYEFPESATKNRELYIERVKKEWVMEVIYHGASDVSTTFSEIEKAMRGDTGASESVTDIGIQSYLKGFEEGMKGKDYSDGKKAGVDGAKAGKNVLAGYQRGIEAKKDKGGKVAQPHEAMKEQIDYENKQGGVPDEHKYDAHKVGYMRGRCTTKAMFASVAEYGAAINGRDKV